METIFSRMTRRSLVRWQFSEEATYRDVLGNNEALHPFVSEGSLDAPERIPAGSAFETVER